MWTDTLYTSQRHVPDWLRAGPKGVSHIRLSLQTRLLSWQIKEMFLDFINTSDRFSMISLERTRGNKSMVPAQVAVWPFVMWPMSWIKESLERQHSRRSALTLNVHQQGAWLAQLEEYATLELGIVSSSPTLCVDYSNFLILKEMMVYYT